MKLGMMNNPANPLLDEIKFASQHKFDFIDLTMEPPGAYALDIEPEYICKLLAELNMDIVGHTAYYLPLASPFQSFRELAIKEFSNCLSVFSKLGITKVNIHPDPAHMLKSREKVIELNIDTIRKIVDIAKGYSIKIMMENLMDIFGDVNDLKKIFDAIPDLRFHLDVGHANLFAKKNKTEEFLSNFYDRLEHIHISDNKGGFDDLHLPLGAGNIDWEDIVGLLKKYAYDGTITLEVFSYDRDYLLLSKEKFEKLWRKG